MARLLWIVGVCALALAAHGQARDRTLVIAPKQEVAGEARHALVIGNGAYAQGPLRNPVNDARAMAKALGEAGFRVLLVEDASQGSMQRAIRTFGDQIAKGGVGLFYFAGHGLQVRGRNYLVPVNADIAREDEIEFNTVDVNLVLAKMDSAKNGLNIVILDACRNNPFQRSFRSMQTGLAQMDAPTGTFIAFATAPGSVAADGAGEHGVYTKYLLGEMTKPGLQIEHLFKQVRNAVMAETKGQQIPWESSSLRGDFAFRAGAPQPSSADLVAEALKREREAQQKEIEKLLAAALERQRKELEAAGVRPMAPAAEIAFWDTIKASSDPADFLAYLTQYPKGEFVALAKNRLAALENKPPSAASDPLEPTPGAGPQEVSLPAKLPRQGDSWTYRLTEPRRFFGPKQSSYSVSVLAVSDSGILERYATKGGTSGEWMHTKGSYLVALGPSLFSPYLANFESLPSGLSLETAIADKGCSGSYFCAASAKVDGWETVTVPAGTFNTVKVTVRHLWFARSASFGGGSKAYEGSRLLTVWYAPEVKRAVKFSSWLLRGDVPPVDADFDLELEAHTVQ